MAVPKQLAVTISEMTSANAYPAPSKNAFGTPRTRHGLLTAAANTPTSMASPISRVS